MVSAASGLVSRSHAHCTGGVSRVVALLLLLMVMMRLRMIAIMLLLRLIMLIVWHNRRVLVISFSAVSQQGGVFATGLLLVVRLWLLLLGWLLLLLGLLLLLNCLLLLLLVVVWLWVRYSMTRLTFVGPGTCDARLTCYIGSSSAATRVGTSGTMLITTGRYRGVGLSLAADVAPMRSTKTTLHAKSPVLRLSSSGGERYLRSQAIARDERAQVVVVLSRWWGSWPGLHYAGIELLLEWKHVNWRIVRWHGGSLRYRTRVRLQGNVSLLAGKGSCGLRGIVDGGRRSCGGDSSSGCRSTGRTQRNGHRGTGRRRRRRSEAILQRDAGGDRKPVHRFGLYSSHDWFSLKFLNIFPQIPERSLCIIVRFERNVPGIVVSKFARDEAWTVFTLEYVLDFLDRRVVRYLA